MAHFDSKKVMVYHLKNSKRAILSPGKIVVDCQVQSTVVERSHSSLSPRCDFIYLSWR